MIVSELIKQLKKFPQDRIVLFSMDEEGNRFHRVANITHTQFDWDPEMPDPNFGGMKVPNDYPADIRKEMPVVIYPLHSEGDFQ